jgi:hypothetical protein
MDRILAATCILFVVVSTGACGDGATETASVEANLPDTDTAPPPWLEMEYMSVAAGLGFGWGEGTLTFEARDYPFSMRGLGLIDIGIARAVASGHVENLDDPADLEGVFVAAEAGATAGVGRAALILRNGNGVVIRLRSELRGARLTLGAEGIRIALK